MKMGEVDTMAIGTKLEAQELASARFTVFDFETAGLCLRGEERNFRPDGIIEAEAGDR